MHMSGIRWVINFCSKRSGMMPGPKDSLLSLVIWYGYIIQQHHVVNAGSCTDRGLAHSQWSHDSQTPCTACKTLDVTDADLKFTSTGSSHAHRVSDSLYKPVNRSSCSMHTSLDRQLEQKSSSWTTMKWPRRLHHLRWLHCRS
jgi:hypothetical protein